MYIAIIDDNITGVYIMHRLCLDFSLSLSLSLSLSYSLSH